MTLTACRDERDPGNVTVQCTYGPATFRVTEGQAHAASFWGQLGRLLAEDPAHAAGQARAAYERYRAHAGGLSVNGDRLPSWEELDEREEGRAVQEHWVAAVSG